MSDTHGCMRCRIPDDAVLEQVGKTRRSEFFSKSYEDESVFRCRSCGALWRRIVERGLGGNGSHWDPAGEFEIETAR